MLLASCRLVFPFLSSPEGRGMPLTHVSSTNLTWVGVLALRDLCPHLPLPVRLAVNERRGGRRADETVNSCRLLRMPSCFVWSILKRSEDSGGIPSAFKGLPLFFCVQNFWDVLPLAEVNPKEGAVIWKMQEKCASGYTLFFFFLLYFFPQHKYFRLLWKQLYNRLWCCLFLLSLNDLFLWALLCNSTNPGGDVSSPSDCALTL